MFKHKLFYKYTGSYRLFFIVIILHIIFFIGIPWLTKISGKLKKQPEYIKYYPVSVINTENIIKINALKNKKNKASNFKKKNIYNLPEPPAKFSDKKLKIRNAMPLNNDILKLSGTDIKYNPVPRISSDKDFTRNDNFTGLKENNNLIYFESDVDNSPKVILKTQPVYPYIAKQMGIEGYVILSFTVTAQGLIDKITVFESSPENIFNTSAVSAVKQWKFRPAVLNNNPVNCRCKLRINYTLTD